MNKCDLVMKGGITSGIVYPEAVCELAKEFRFANIGGTSAGAIAAALTAAAEHRRQTSGSMAGFDEIAKLPAWLGEGEGGRSHLLRLFQPSDDGSPLFDVVAAFVETRGSKVTRGVAALRVLVSRFQRFGSMVAFVGIVFAVVSAVAAAMLWADSRVVASALMAGAAAALIATAGGVVAAAAVEALLHARRALPASGFGVCSGRTMEDAGTAGLTDWLAERIDSIAGTGHPLTFGDLWGAESDGRTVNLEMMTTNLTHGRPYRLPLESRNLWFAASEMRRLFPDRIVDWMIERSGASGRRHSLADGECLFRLPPAADLPVVVATRMSLSFPILLSAVPLWSIDFARRGARPAPERCWFSDGGITSNFPVHFFDAPLPRWPTFAINLAGRSSRYHDEGQRTYVPRTNRSGIQEWWSPFTTVGGFLGAIAGTMQNWRDNMLLHLPGQRDRIAHVLLGPDEGGLNLTMDAATIQDVAGRGAEAARTLRERFGASPAPDATLTWANHKWVRFLAFMGAQEQALESWTRAFDDRTLPPTFRELVSGPRPLPSYKIGPQQRQAAASAALAFLQHIQGTFGNRPFRAPARRPRGDVALRMMPRE